MSQPLDVSYVELKIKGERETAKKIHDMLVDIERAAHDAAADIEASLTSATEAVEHEVAELTRVVEREANQQERAIRDVAEAIATDISAGAEVAKRAVDDLADDATRDLKRIERASHKSGMSLAGIGENASLALTGLQVVLAKALAGVINLGSSGGLQGLIAGVTTFLTLAPAVVALGGALFDLVGVIGLIPAGLASAVAVGATLMLTFHGIGDAISALASGDAAKIKEAMKGLAPAARSFAKEINALRKPFDDLRRSIQQSFFAEFSGAITKLATAAIPTLKVGLSDISGALGRFGTAIADLFSSNDILEAFGDVFETTGNIIDKLTPTVVHLLGTIIGMAEAGLPYLERFFDNIDRGLQKFDEFLSTSLQSGGFNQFLEDAFKTMGELVELGGALGRLLLAIFGDSGDEGRSLIQVLTDVTNKLTEFFSSAQGREDMQKALDTIVELGSVLITVTGIVIQAVHIIIEIKNAISSFVSFITDTAIPAVGGFFSMLGQKAQEIGTAIADFFTRVGEFFASVGQTAVNAYNTVVTFLGQVISFFTALPGQIMAGLAALPGLIIGFFAYLFDTVTYGIGYGIGRITRFFIELPGNIMSAISSLASLVANVFIAVSEVALRLTTNVINAVVSFFSQLPGRTYSATVSVIDKVRDIFTSVWNTASNTASNIISSVTSFFSQLPGRVASAISSLPDKIYGVLRSIIGGAQNIGEDIIAGVGRGIMNGVGAVVSLAKRAANNILQGMKDALGISSPSKVAKDEVGAQITAGAGLGVQEELPSLLGSINAMMRDIIPGVSSTTNNVTDAGAAVTFGPGAVQVIMNGNTSPAEAATIGRMVGQGIVDAISRSRTRLDVRTI